MGKKAGTGIAFLPEKQTMKKLSILFVSLFLIIGSQAQFRKVTSTVTNAFKASYPTAKNVTWKDNLTNFEAQFDLGGRHTVAKFNADGSWLETEQDLQYTDLNSAVKDGFTKSKYKEWHQREIKQIQQKDKATVYRIYVSKSDVTKRYLYFNVQGRLLRDPVTI
jgi:hypothetical protein